jgi:hypothetical protein
MACERIVAYGAYLLLHLLSKLGLGSRGKLI